MTGDKAKVTGKVWSRWANCCQCPVNSRSPRDLTFHLSRQSHPSLQGHCKDAPREEVEDDTQQVQPPHHLFAGRERGEGVKGDDARTGAALDWPDWVGTHRIAQQIDSEVRVIAPGEA